MYRVSSYNNFVYFRIFVYCVYHNVRKSTNMSYIFYQINVFGDFLVVSFVSNLLIISLINTLKNINIIE